MADVTEDLRLPSLAQVKDLIAAITASDVGAVAQFNDTPDYIIKDATYPTAYVCSINGRDYMPNTGYFRILYLPYFAYEQGYAVQVAFGAVANDGLWFRKASGETWNDWKQVMQADGSVAMSGALWLNGSYGRANSYLSSEMQFTELQAISDLSNSTMIQVRHGGDVATSLHLLRFEGGKNTAYANIYGEHNVTCGTSDITAGSTALTTGCYYDVYK